MRGRRPVPHCVPLPASYVRAKVGTVDKRLAVLGDRVWLDLITATPYTATISVVVGELKKPTAVGTVMGTVSIGPICPVEREGVPCEISAEVYTSRNVVVYAKNGITVITKQPLDTTGHFKLDLAPGHYQLQIDPAGISAGEKKPITVVSGETMVTDFDIDTGIR